MKRRKVHFDTQAEEYSHSNKKQKLIRLSASQKVVADDDVMYFLNKGKKYLLKTELELMFDNPKEFETLLTYTNYKMFWWAIEHNDIELMQYILDHTTGRGKFLVVCHNNYELLKNFVHLAVQKLEDGTYSTFPAEKILKTLINANSNRSHLIIDVLKNYIDKNTEGHIEITDILKHDLHLVPIKLTDTQNNDCQIDYISNSPDLSDNDNEQVLIGNIDNDNS